MSRFAAMLATQKFAPGTVGFVVHRAVKVVYPLVGNVASGTIGEHYQERATQELLARSATDSNLKTMAVRETQYWKSASPQGLPRAVGSAMSESARYGMLVAMREASLIEGAKARCEFSRE